MKKRIVSLALTLCLLAGLLPCLTLGAAAAEGEDYVLSYRERGICEKLRRESGHRALHLAGAVLYGSVLRRLLGQLCRLCQP